MDSEEKKKSKLNINEIISVNRPAYAHVTVRGLHK